ncbi:MAG: hypothetical protein ACM3QU_13200 [Verrucomicrobiota bacterium]
MGLTALLALLVVFVGAGAAARTTAPANTYPPTISGTAQEGKTLTGDRGNWSNNPTGYDYAWLRCDHNGGSCSTISGADSKKYELKSNDVGNTLRFQVKAKNADGTTTATSIPTGVVVAETSDLPVNTKPPRISGTPQQGKVLSADRGSWTHDPSSYAYVWLRCDKIGGSCSAIGGATSTKYTLTSVDVNNTLRFRVTATNSGGSTTATSVPTGLVAAPAPPPKPGGANGCPPGDGADQAASISPPARLLVDTLQSNPQVATAGTRTLIVRFHVTSTCGGPVQGALVYATATPYNQFAIPSEQRTGADGWAELRFQRLSGFPVSGKQQLIAMFVRARKSGEGILGGISTRRLVSIRVSPHS